MKNYIDSLYSKFMVNRDKIKNKQRGSSKGRGFISLILHGDKYLIQNKAFTACINNNIHVHITQ